LINATSRHKGDKQVNTSATVFIGNRFHATPRIPGPTICKQCSLEYRYVQVLIIARRK